MDTVGLRLCDQPSVDLMGEKMLHAAQVGHFGIGGATDAAMSLAMPGSTKPQANLQTKFSPTVALPVCARLPQGVSSQPQLR